MKKLLFALAIIIMVTIPAALAESTIEAVAVIGGDTTKASGTSVDITSITLNLVEEKLEDADTLAKVKAWSTDGSKWTSGKPDIAKLLNKGGTLYLTSGTLSGKSINEDKDYQIVQFPTINKRPKANPDKMKPWYLDDGTWDLTPKGLDAASAVANVYWSINDLKSAATEEYEFALSTDGRKPKSGSAWAVFEAGIEVAAAGSTKLQYIFRIPASIAEDGKSVTPASKLWKVKPALQGKAPKLKVDYKKEIIKLKKGIVATATTVSAEPFNGKALADKAEASVSAIIDGDTAAGKGAGDQTISVWIGATGKKPATAVQVIKLAKRAEAPTGTLKLDKGKIKDDKTKTLEVFNAGDEKPTKLPKFSAAEAVTGVRVKGSVKLDDKGVPDANSYAASKGSTLTVTWGIYVGKEEDGTAKEGVTKAEFAAAS